MNILSSGKSLTYKLKHVERIYSFFGYPDLKYFLSILDPDRRNLVIVPDIVAKCRFLSDVVGEDQIISLIDPPYFGHPHPALKTWPQHFLPFLDAAIKLRYLFRFTNKKAEAFMLNDFSVFTIFVLTGVFRRRNIKIKNIDALPWLRTEKSLDDVVRSRGLQFKRYLKILSLIAGTEITEAIYRLKTVETADPDNPASVTAVGYALADPVEKIEIAVAPWSKLIERFKFSCYVPSGKAILIIETPFSEVWQKVDAESTYIRVANYLRSILKEDEKIHFKPHYRYPGLNAFKNTVVEDRVQVLEASVPAEVYLEFYDRIYFFLSSSAMIPCRGRKYCLSPLIVFLSEDEKKRYLIYQDMSFGDQMNDIEFVSDLEP